MKFYSLVILLFLALIVAVPPASAQDEDMLLMHEGILSSPELSIEEDSEPAPPESFLDVLATLPEEIQEELLKESEQAQYYCRQNYMYSNYYDCSCVSLKFMEERYLTGPEQAFVNVLGNLNAVDCIYEPSIAGLSYDKCVGLMRMKYKSEKELNRVCECTARESVKAYKANPVQHSRYVADQFTRSLNTCVNG